MNIWTFADHCRANVKSAPKTNDDDRPILTGMALGLNSTLPIADGTTKLPPCPMLLLSNSHGILQVYYFTYKSLPSICRPAEVIKISQLPIKNIGIATSQPAPFNFSASPLTTCKSLSFFSFTYSDVRTIYLSYCCPIFVSFRGMSRK